MDDRAADLALLSVAMPKPATTDTIAAGSSVAVFFIGGHFLYICRDASLPPCRTEVGAGLDRRFARVAAFGPLLSQKAGVPHGPGVPAMERAFRRRMERNGSLSGAQSSREKPARAKSVPLVLPELMERVGLL